MALCKKNVSQLTVQSLCKHGHLLVLIMRHIGFKQNVNLFNNILFNFCEEFNLTKVIFLSYLSV